MCSELGEEKLQLQLYSSPFWCFQGTELLIAMKHYAVPN